MYEKFPTPLINRLEKHFVLTSSVLKEWQQEVLTHFENWIEDFSGVRYERIGHEKYMCAKMHATAILHIHSRHKTHNIDVGVSVEMILSRKDMLSLAIKRTPQPLLCFRLHDNSRS